MCGQDWRQFIIHTSTHTQADIRIKGEQEIKWFAWKCKKRQNSHTASSMGSFNIVDTVGRGQNVVVHSSPRSTVTQQVHENLEHPWEQPVYTMPFIVHSLYSDIQSEATYPPVLWFRSLVSCPLAFVVEFLVFVRWSVIEKLKSPEVLPPIMGVYKGPSPVLFCLIILCPLLLFEMVHARILVKWM